MDLTKLELLGLSLARASSKLECVDVGCLLVFVALSKLDILSSIG